MSAAIRTLISTEAVRYLGLVLSADQVAALRPTPAGITLDGNPRTVLGVRRVEPAIRAGLPALYELRVRPAIHVGTFAGCFTTCGWGQVSTTTPLLRDERIDGFDDSHGPYVAEVYSCEHHTTHFDAVVHVHHPGPEPLVTAFGPTDRRGPIRVQATDIDAWPGSLTFGSRVEVLGGGGVRTARVSDVAGTEVTLTFDGGHGKRAPWEGWDQSPSPFPASPADRLSLSLALGGADIRGYPHRCTVRMYRAGFEQWSGPASQVSLEAAQALWRQHPDAVPTPSGVMEMLRAALEREVTERDLSARWESIEFQLHRDEPQVDLRLAPPTAHVQ